jgi:hypothetical protein
MILGLVAAMATLSLKGKLWPIVLFNITLGAGHDISARQAHVRRLREKHDRVPPAKRQTSHAAAAQLLQQSPTVPADVYQAFAATSTLQELRATFVQQPTLNETIHSFVRSNGSLRTTFDEVARAIIYYRRPGARSHLRENAQHLVTWCTRELRRLIREWTTKQTRVRKKSYRLQLGDYSLVAPDPAK